MDEDEDNIVPSTVTITEESDVKRQVDSLGNAGDVGTIEVGRGQQCHHLHGHRRLPESIRASYLLIICVF